MSRYQIATVVGSLRRDSFNRKLAQAVIRLAPPEFSFRLLSIGDLPLYNQDDDDHQADAVVQMKDEILSSQGLLFVTPEYNRSIPGVLKNALDIASRPWGTNSFAGKPGGVIGASIGSTGSALAQQHLRNVLAYLDVAVLAQPEVFVQFKNDELIDAQGQIASDDTRKFLQGYVDRYAAWVRAHTSR